MSLTLVRVDSPEGIAEYEAVFVEKAGIRRTGAAVEDEGGASVPLPAKRERPDGSAECASSGQGTGTRSG